MKGVGTYHELVPRDRVKNLEYRRKLLGLCGGSLLDRRAVWEMCRRDVLFYVNAFVWTYDPRTELKTLPFATYEYQDVAIRKMVECVELGKDLVIEKSRDMGASWLSLVVMEWFWHFHEGYTFLMISRLADLVDKSGDPDSLLWKIDFIHKWTPGWLMPQLRRRRMSFVNQDTGSTMDGAATTGAAGVGGRRSAVFVDEFSRIDEGYQLLAGLADTTKCRIFNFTPWGTANAAYKLAKRTDIEKLRMHWTAHPEKARGLYQYDPVLKRVVAHDKQFFFSKDYKFVHDGKLRSPWYDAECDRRGNPREVAMMLDIDYLGSEYQFFDATTIVELQAEYAMDAMWEGDIDCNPATGDPVAFVRGIHGPVRMWVGLTGSGRPPRKAWVGACDISAGQGATNSCFSIVDADTGEKVLEYATPFMRPEEFAVKVVAICKMFETRVGTCYLAWEAAGPGLAFGKKVVELGYGNIYYRKSETNLNAMPTTSPGWYPTNDSKRVLLENYRSALSGRRMINRSREALEETLSFVFTKRGTVEHSGQMDDEDPTGAGSNHGDRVIADALAWRLVEESGYLPDARRVAQEHGSVMSTNCMAYRRKLIEEEKQKSMGWWGR